MSGSKKTLFRRIVISTVGIALIVLAIVYLLLFFLGETAAASVKTRRFGGADSGRPPSQRYEWSLDYTFKDRNGILRSGHTTRRGSDMSVKTDDRVYYLTFAPFVNALENEAKPGLSQPLYIAVGSFLLYSQRKKA